MKTNSLAALLMAAATVLLQSCSTHANGSPEVLLTRRMLAVDTTSTNGGSPAGGPSAAASGTASILTYTVPAYKPDNYSVIVNQRFLVSIDRPQGTLTSTSQPFAFSEVTTLGKNAFDEFSGAGCVVMNFTSNSSSAQTAVVAHLADADQNSAPDQDQELPWSHCSGPSCAIIVPTYLNNTYFTGVENNATDSPYNYTMSYTLLPTDNSDCKAALNALPEATRSSYYLQSHPFADASSTPANVFYRNVGPSSLNVIASFVNTSCVYMGGYLQSDDKDVELVILEDSAVGAWFKSSSPPASSAQCGIGSGGDCTANKYGQYKLDATKVYYLVLQNKATNAEDAVVYLNIRDAATCTADGLNTKVYSN